MIQRDTYIDDIKAYADGELNLICRFKLRMHIMKCASCQKELSEMTQIAEDIKNTTEEQMNPMKNSLRSEILNGYESTVPIISRKTNLKSIYLYRCIVIIAIIGFIGFIASSTTRDHNSSLGFKSERTQEVKKAAAINPYDGSPMSSIMEAKSPTSVYASPTHDTDKSVGYSSVPGEAQSTTSNAAFYDLRQIHREAAITVEVENAEEKSNKIEEYVKSAGGYISNNNLVTNEGSRNAEINIKAPVGQFDLLLSQISKLGAVKAKNVTGEDITDKISDSSQKDAVLSDDLQKVVDRIKRAGPKATWQDKELLRELKVQVAQNRGRLMLLKKLGELSEVTVTLYEKPHQAMQSTGFWSDIANNSKYAISSVLSTAAVFITGFIWVLIYLPIWLPLTLAVKWIYRRYILQGSVGSTPS